MSTLRISEADAARDFAALLQKLGEVSEIVIERNDTNAVLTLQKEPDPAYQVWFEEQVQLAYEDQDQGVDLEQPRRNSTSSAKPSWHNGPLTSEGPAHRARATGP